MGEPRKRDANRWVGLGLGIGVGLFLAACGTANEERHRGMEAWIEQARDEGDYFRADLRNSALGREEFDGKVHFIRIGQPYTDEHGEARQVEIQSGDMDLQFYPGGLHTFWGMKINLHNWRGETGVFPVHHGEMPSHVTHAALRWGETVLRDGSLDQEEDWYNFHNFDAHLAITEVDLDAGRIRAEVYLEGVLRQSGEPRPDPEEAPVFVFDGAFHLREQASFERSLFR